eukprot:m.99587 g.99587  ORF g.99587 m.99587 type:complete len:744 (+) comp15102_c0_seq4:62-2293(+)
MDGNSVDAAQDFVITTSISSSEAIMDAQDEPAAMSTAFQLDQTPTVEENQDKSKGSLRRHATRLANAVEPYTAQEIPLDTLEGDPPTYSPNQDEPDLAPAPSALSANPVFESKNLELIEACRDDQVERALELLSEPGVDVNYQNVFQQSALTFACSHGHQTLVDALLEKGANPNAVDANNQNSLTIALIRRNHIITRQLIATGMDLTATVVALTNVLEGVKDYELKQLIQDDVLSCHPEPIPACFKLGLLLKRLAQRQEERFQMYTTLAQVCTTLAVDLLGQSRDMWDVRRLLADRTNILDDAVRYNQEEFVAHPFSQEYLKELWFGSLKGTYGSDFTWQIVKYLSFIVVFPLFTIDFLLLRHNNITFSRLGDYLELWHTPFIKFVGHMISFIAYLILLLVVVGQSAQEDPSKAEVALAFWVVALLAQEVREIYQTPTRIYFSSIWNLFDLLAMFMLVIVIILRMVVWTSDYPGEADIMYSSNVLLAFSAVLSILRLLNILETNSLLGPLQISIRQILQDLMVFLCILLVFVVAFSAGLTKLYESVEDIPENEEVLAAFGNFGACLRTSFWALFGLIELGTLTVEGRFAQRIQATGEIVFGIYMVLVFILLVNLLIAMISNTYQRIADNSDTIWKFARARLIREFQRYPSVPAPLNLVTEPISFLLKGCNINVKSWLRSEGHSSSDDAEEDTQLRRLMVTLVERHRKSHTDEQVCTLPAHTIKCACLCYLEICAIALLLRYIE